MLMKPATLAPIRTDTYSPWKKRGSFSQRAGVTALIELIGIVARGSVGQGRRLLETPCPCTDVYGEGVV
jgi:hypothetical protein